MNTPEKLSELTADLRARERVKLYGPLLHQAADAIDGLRLKAEGAEDERDGLQEAVTGWQDRAYAAEARAETAEAALKVATWRPIEGAPKDGTHILACNDAATFGWGDGKPLPSVQTVVHWYEFGEESGWYTSVNEMAPDRTFPATHWKPLDDPNDQALSALQLPPEVVEESSSVGIPFAPQKEPSADTRQLDCEPSSGASGEVEKKVRTVCRVEVESGSLDDHAEIDDLVVSGDLIDCVHIERMSRGDVWGSIYFRDGSPRLYLWWQSKRNIEFTGYWDGRRETWPCEVAPEARSDTSRSVGGSGNTQAAQAAAPATEQEA